METTFLKTHQLRSAPAAIVLALAIADFAPVGAAAPAAESAHEQVVRIVTQIKRADYEGDRAALAKLYDDLGAAVDDEQIGSRVRYWRGFALWRRAINGFNESVEQIELEADLTRAVAEFDAAATADPGFVDARVGIASCLGYVMFLHRGEPVRLQELAARVGPLLRELKTAAPENPRLLWAMGPVVWNTPPERGGGQDRAIESYEKALDALRGRNAAATDPLEPSWGEPELLMNLAWSHLNKTAPDPAAAQRYAGEALELVPYWHYVKDILLAQIKEAGAKAGSAKPADSPEGGDE